MNLARSGSPGSRTDSAIWPFSAPMCNDIVFPITFPAAKLCGSTAILAAAWQGVSAAEAAWVYFFCCLVKFSNVLEENEGKKGFTISVVAFLRRPPAFTQGNFHFPEETLRFWHDLFQISNGFTISVRKQRNFEEKLENLKLHPQKHNTPTQPRRLPTGRQGEGGRQFCSAGMRPCLLSTAE